MIKFGSRKNLLYPSMLVLFIGLMKLIELIIDSHYNKDTFTLQFVYALSKIVFGAITTLNNYCSVKNIQNKDLISRKKVKKDSTFKKIVLIFLASYFDFFVSVTRSFYVKGDTITKSIKSRIRCFQIFFAGILCYYTIRIKLYKHHIVGLVSIFICLMIIIITEIICKKFDLIDIIDDGYLALIATILSNLGRSFLDTIEKYLFEFDYTEPYRVLMFEGIINIFSFYGFYLFLGQPSQTKKFSVKDPIFENHSLNIATFFVLVFFYFIFAGFRNVYRVLTIKQYSPMARALTEALFDPFQMAYKLRQFKNSAFYWINIICLLIMVFFSLVFNEFLILYCCGLEYNTHIEITKRSDPLKRQSDMSETDDGYLTELPKNDKYESEISLINE
jgi:hypothetical protein